MPPKWERAPRFHVDGRGFTSMHDFHVRNIGMDGNGYVRENVTGPPPPVVVKDINKPTQDWPRQMHGMQWHVTSKGAYASVTSDGFALQVTRGPGRFDWFCAARDSEMFHEGRVDTLRTAIYDAARSLYAMRNLREISDDVPPWP